MDQGYNVQVTIWPTEYTMKLTSCWDNRMKKKKTLHNGEMIDILRNSTLNRQYNEVHIF